MIDGRGFEIYPHPDDEKCSYDEYAAARKAARFTGTRPRHGWENGVQLRPADCRLVDGKRATAKIFVLENSSIALLPQLHIVKELLVRRQFLRRIPVSLLAAIMDQLPGLERVHIESWLLRRMCEGYRLPPSLWRSQRILPVMLWLFHGRDSLASVSLFEDHNQFLHSREILGDAVFQERLDPSLGAIMADETRHLQHFSVAFIVDATNFFQDFQADAPLANNNNAVDLSRGGVHHLLVSLLPEAARARWLRRSLRFNPKNGDPRDGDPWLVFQKKIGEAVVRDVEALPTHKAASILDLAGGYKPSWPYLRTLALTCDGMDPDWEVPLNARGRDASGRLTELFISAGRAAMRMPSLETMEIWNGGKAFACVFRYEREGAHELPTLTLSLTWPYRDDPRVKEQWDKVAIHYFAGAGLPCRGIKMGVVKLEAGDFKTHGSVIPLLKLAELVVHPVSMCQMKWEADNNTWPGP